jgi:hypothetical protein
MKKTTLIFIAIVSILSFCKKNECKDSQIATKHFETDYGCQNTKHSLIIDLTDSATIISSKVDYDAKVSGGCHPEIDFSIYDLVIGKQKSGNLNDTILYDFKRTCPDKELTLTVDIIQSALTVPDNVVYHAIIPKLGDKETLNIKINVR